MGIITPNWNQAQPTWDEVGKMCGRIRLEPLKYPTEPFEKFLKRLRDTHSNGGAYLGAFEVEVDPTFDWFASRNRLCEKNLLDRLMLNRAIVEGFPELRISAPSTEGKGFCMSDPFLLDGTLSRILYNGGAYGHGNGNGRADKVLALEVCDAMFGLRFAEVTYDVNHDAWTPWFKGVAWDLTAILFDLRLRSFWMLVVTDTD